jgi:hypothetical protein
VARVTIATALVAAVATVPGVALADKKPVAKQCPQKTLVESTLRQKIVKVTQTIANVNDGLGVATQTRTCFYKTNLGTTIQVEITAGAQILAFVDGYEAAVEQNTGYQTGHRIVKHVVPVFGAGNDAWGIKEGGSISALYHTNAVVINAPNTSLKELKTLVQATLGIPSATVGQV